MKRLGCSILLALWFAFLLLPCALLYLATNGEIRIAPGQADMPQPHAHPLLLVSLIGEIEERGLRIETSTIVSSVSGPGAEAQVCVETAARFLLWQTRGGAQDARYCDCYQRSNAESAWQLTATYRQACAAETEDMSN